MARKCDEAVGVESPDSITRRRVILVEEAAEQGPPANVAPVDRDWLLDREIFRTLDAAADGLTRFATYYNYDRLHGELDWHTPAESTTERRSPPGASNACRPSTTSRAGSQR